LLHFFCFQITSNGLSYRTSTKASRPPIVAQEIHQPDVETWASSTDDDSDSQWPEIEENLPVFNDIDTPSNSPIYSHKVTDARSKTKNNYYKSRSIDSSPSRSKLSQNSVSEQLGDEFEIKVDRSKLTKTSRNRNTVDFFAEIKPELKSTSRVSASNSKDSTPELKNSLKDGMDSGDAKNPLLTINSAFQAPNAEEVNIIHSQSLVAFGLYSLSTRDRYP